MTVKIVDELGFVYEWICENADEVQSVVNEWLETLDSTPLYSIEILL